VTAVHGLVVTRPGSDLKKEHFLANGGVLSYEAQPYALDDGLVETATPECRGPSEAVLYQRAQEALLVRALPAAQDHLASLGHRGRLSLLKNCRDGAGHTYGAQENYEALLARGGWLLAWRVGLVALVPLVAVSVLATWALVVVLLPIAIAGMLIYGVLGAIPGLRWIRRVLAVDGHFVRALHYPVHWIERAVWEPAVIPFLLLYRACAFRRLRRGLLPFLISRPIITGAGTLIGDRLALSEKGVAVRRQCRWSLGRGVSVFEGGNLVKAFAAPSRLDFTRYASLFRDRQRFQLGFSDSNMAQTAEYLKVALTCLVIDLIEAGAVEPPRVRRPLRQLRRIVDGDHATALALQRAYLEAARAHLAASPATSLELTEVVARWGIVLDAIEQSPEMLVGQIDWITKRSLLVAGETRTQRKKIDLKYHQLATGYFAWLERKQLAPILVTADEARRACDEPPATTPARERARLIRNLPYSVDVRVGWSHVQVGTRIRGRVIRLDDHRDPGTSD
jgi:Pup amidohydrolase